jgi:hypothetical protein
MAAHLLITACLIAEPHTCSEIEVPGVVLEDVVSCSQKSHDIFVNWQNDHKDQYLAIAAKCLLVPSDNPAASSAPGANAGGANDNPSGGSNGEAAKPDDSSKTEPAQQ